MSYPNVLAQFFGQPFYLTEQKYLQVEEFLRQKAAETPATKKAKKNAADLAMATPGGRNRASNFQMVGSSAVVSVFGVLLNRCGPLEQMSGCTSAEELGVTIDALAGDKSVKSIVLVFDSPGGSVAGTPELAARVARAATQKKVVAVADSMMASAAYYVGSQASEVFASPSSTVGSIGVIASHLDDSVAAAQAGLKTTYVTAGQHKGEGYGPLTEDAKGYLQSIVNEMYASFVKAVAKGRGVSEATVRSESWGQGRILTAAAAKTVNMVDGVATLETVLRRLGANGDGGRGARAEADVAIRARAVKVETETAAPPGGRAALLAAARARAVEVQARG